MLNCSEEDEAHDFDGMYTVSSVKHSDKLSTPKRVHTNYWENQPVTLMVAAI